MLSRIAADALLVLHLAFILFVVAGGWLVLRRRAIMWFHVPAAVWGAFVELTGGVCPLTPLENQLRVASGSAGYTGGFVERYLVPVIYPANLERPLQVVLGLFVVLMNIVVYARVVTKGVRQRRGG